MGRQELGAVGRERVPLDLESEWRGQSQRLLLLGFHKELGLTADAYLAGLPKFEPQPQAYKDRFDIPVLVDPRVPLLRQAKLLGIKDKIELDKVENLTNASQNANVMWTHDGRNYKGQAIVQAEKNFAADEVGCTQVEVTALFIQRPDLFDKFAISAVGSRSGNALMVPFLHKMDQYRRPGIGRGSPDLPHGLWAPLSRGKRALTVFDVK